MFYDTKAYVLDANTKQSAVILVDIQPYDKTLQYEEGIEIDIIKRVFCDKNPNILETGYFQIADSRYKIIKIKEWNDCLECWLYLCEGGNYEAD